MSESEEDSQRSATSIEETRVKKTPLFYSRRIGSPPYVLDPKDLPRCFDLAPQKLGARLRRIDEHTVVKYGESVRIAEAEAMHMIREKTSVVCPEAKDAYILEGVGYIIMSYEGGEHLSTYWPHASADQREDVIRQLKNYVSQMREIKGDFIGGVDYSHCVDGIFDWDYVGGEVTYGPYEDEASFNEGIVEALSNRSSPEGRNTDPESIGVNLAWEFDRLVQSFKGHSIVFTHGDLHGGNIKVRDDGTVVLLDWGLAGFWPEYWEFHRATFMGTFQPDFIRQIEIFIPSFYVEAFVMRRIFGRMIG